MKCKKYLVGFLSLLCPWLPRQAACQMPLGGVMVYQQSDIISRGLYKSIIQGRNGLLWIATSVPAGFTPFKFINYKSCLWRNPDE